MGDNKSSLGLLNGIAKRDYYNEAGITNEFLHEQLYPDLPEEEFTTLLGKYESLLRNIVYSNMDLKQLDAFLTSQKRKMPDFLSDDQTANITKFWKLNRQKIHDVIVDRSSWNNQMRSMQWRIDISYKDNVASDSPKVIFALDVNEKVPNANGSSSKSMLQFEVDSTKLDEMISEIESIEKKISDFAN